MKRIQDLKKIRESLLTVVSSLTNEQLNTVPAGFNNNIIWNMGHLLVTQQGICYRPAGEAMHLDAAFYDRFKPGSKPEGPVSDEDIAWIKTELLRLIDVFEADFQSGKFQNYTPWTTRLSGEIDSIQAAIDFVYFHEGLHYGYAMALKKLV